MIAPPAASPCNGFTLRRPRWAHRSTLCAAALLVTPLVPPVCAQEPDIRAGVSLVIAPVSVTTRKGAPIQTLAKDDFLVTVEGQRQNFSLDETVAPLSLVVVAETGDLASAAVAKVRKVGALLQPTLAGQNGDVAVIGFAGRPEVVRAFGGYPNAQDALAHIESGGGGAAILDAVMAATRLLAERPPGDRKVILLISETKDRGSKIHLSDLIPVLQRENVELYALTFSPYLTPFTAKPEDAPPGDMNLLAVFGEIGRAAKHSTVAALVASTGGSHLEFLKQAGLEESLEKIGTDLHSQYVLSFSPSVTTAGFHPLEIQVLSHPEAGVRTRPGYWIAKP